MKKMQHSNMTISVGVFVPKTLHDLAKDTICSYFKITDEDLLSTKRKLDSVHRRALLFTLLFDAGYTTSQIGEIYGLSRQVVANLVNKIKDAGGRYLHIICDYNNVTELFTTLQLKQKECLSQFSHIQ